MRKTVWIMVVAGVIVIGAIFLLTKKPPELGISGVEDQKEVAGKKLVSQISSLPSSDESQPLVSGSSERDVDVAVTLPEPELSEPVQILLGLDGRERNYPELLAAIRRLGYELSAADVAALREMLMFPNDRFPAKMRPIEVNAVKNDVLDMLLRQKDLPEGLGLQMAEMAEDSENDPVWRDYCVQFMEPFYSRASGEIQEKGSSETSVSSSDSSAKASATEEAGGGKLSDELTAVHDAMFSALDERSETIAATALIGLESLSRTHDEFNREQIVKKAIEMASDERASSSVRLTALRLPAVVENKGLSNNEQGTSNVEVAKTARTLAQTGETVLLRSAAIVTLGEVGSANDRELLESFTFAENKQIADAARLALNKMDSRN